MYNRTGFNRSRYNRAASTSQYRAAPVVGIGIISTPPLGGTIPLRLVQVVGAGEMHGEYTILIRLGTMEVNGEGSATVLVAIVTNLGLSPVSGIGIVAAPRVILYLSTDIALGDMILAPGDVLEIDTDSITVTRNGISVIQYWVTGSTPFQLAAGDNVITYHDESPGRSATVAIVWKNRWL